jgi:hypothetical protein
MNITFVLLFSWWVSTWSKQTVTRRTVRCWHLLGSDHTTCSVRFSVSLALLTKNGITDEFFIVTKIWQSSGNLSIIQFYQCSRASIIRGPVMRRVVSATRYSLVTSKQRMFNIFHVCFFNVKTCFCVQIRISSCFAYMSDDNCNKI